MVYDGVHEHIKEGGGQGVDLGNSTLSLEERAILSSGPGQHGELYRVHMKDLERPGSDLVCCKNLEASIPIQGVVRLLGIHVDMHLSG